MKRKHFEIIQKLIELYFINPVSDGWENTNLTNVKLHFHILLKNSRISQFGPIVIYKTFYRISKMEFNIKITQPNFLEFIKINTTMQYTKQHSHLDNIKNKNQT